MNKKQLKDLKSILRSFELNGAVLSNILHTLEKEQTVLEFRQTDYDSKITEYRGAKASDMDDRIDELEKQTESLEEIDSQICSLIDALRQFLSNIETSQFNADIQQITRATSRINSQIKQLRDPLFEEVAELVVASGMGSTSGIQRRYSIGYNRAGQIMDQLEAAGIVGPSVGAKPREILVDIYMLQEMLRTE